MKSQIVVGFTGIFFLMVLFSCTENTKSDASWRMDQWEEMMAVHDEVMPKIMDITKLVTEVKKDSLNPEASQILAELEEADSLMWDWMHNLTPWVDIENMSDEEAKEALMKETGAIEIVAQKMNESISNARQFLEQ